MKEVIRRIGARREAIAWTLVGILAVSLIASLTFGDNDDSSLAATGGPVLSNSTTSNNAPLGSENSTSSSVASSAGSGPTTSAPTATAATGGSSTAVPTGPLRTVGPGQMYSTLQQALDAAQPGDVVELTTTGAHKGPAKSVRSGTPDRPITVTAVAGARLDCGSPKEGEVARCFELNHSYFRFQKFAITGGSSNLYLVGVTAGSYVHDVKILQSVFRGAQGTGECIRVKYQAFNVEIAGNDIADCGIGKCCKDSKNGEAVYIGTAPEQLAEKNPTSEPDRTHDIWVHHNVMRPYNECVDIKEASYNNLIEYNDCSGQRDPDSAGMGSRGGRVGEGNTFRFNLVEKTTGACARFGGDEDPDGTGNSFYGNRCRDISGEWGVAQQRSPQHYVCGNTFEGSRPEEGLSRDKKVDPTAGCAAEVPRNTTGLIGAG